MHTGGFGGPGGPGLFGDESRRGPRGGDGDRRGAQGGRGRGQKDLFSPFGPFGPFGPRRRRSSWKYLIAAAVARMAAERVLRGVARGEFRRGRRGRGRRSRNSWFGASSAWRPWWRRDDLTKQRARRAERLLERAKGERGRDDGDGDQNQEQTQKREGWMPRFDSPFSGPKGPRGRRFDRGDVKYLLLDLLREGPRHGYDMIKEMEKRSGGFYTPSPGSVYPTLQMLEDQGLVTSTTIDGKRTYRLTDAGYTFIEERPERTDDVRERASWPEPGDEIRDTIHSVGRDAGDLARSLRDAIRARTPDTRQINEIRDVIGETRRRIETILAERREAERNDRDHDRDRDRDKPTTV